MRPYFSGKGNVLVLSEIRALIPLSGVSGDGHMIMSVLWKNKGHSSNITLSLSEVNELTNAFTTYLDEKEDSDGEDSIDLEDEADSTNFLDSSERKKIFNEARKLYADGANMSDIEIALESALHDLTVIHGTRHCDCVTCPRETWVEDVHFTIKQLSAAIASLPKYQRSENK
jgi:hypothetical protein